MVLKIRPLAFVLLMIMIMLFSSVVSGQDEPKRNLLIGGVWQIAEDQAKNLEYARLLNAEYIPTYYSRTKNPYAALDKTTITGKVLADVNTNEALVADAVAKAADISAVDDATPVRTSLADHPENSATAGGMVYRGNENPSPGAPEWAKLWIEYLATDLNGLTDERLNPSKDGLGDHYGTIYVHSGGARTAVTALLYQGVTADTLVLISPANGGKDDESYKQELQKLLDSKIVKEIVLYQSEDPKDDAAFVNDLWQTRFEKGDISGNFRIEPVTNKQLLGKKWTEGHIQMWETVINSEISHGQCSAQPPKSTGIQLSGTEFPDWMQSPKSKQTSGLESWGKHPKGWGVSQEYVNAHPEIYGGPSSDFKPSSPQSGSDSGNSGSPGTPQSPQGLTPEQKKAIQDWIDSGAGQPYDPPAVETNPVFEQAHKG
jgi:hypothetical protein